MANGDSTETAISKIDEFVLPCLRKKVIWVYVFMKQCLQVHDAAPDVLPGEALDIIRSSRAPKGLNDIANVEAIKLQSLQCE